MCFILPEDITFGGGGALGLIIWRLSASLPQVPIESGALKNRRFKDDKYRF